MKAQYLIIRKLLSPLHNNPNQINIQVVNQTIKKQMEKPHTEVDFKYYLKRLLSADWREKAS